MARVDEPAAVGEVTALLRAASTGDEQAFDRLFAAVYDQLRRVARGRLRAVGDEAVRPTELVHELYFKLRGHLDTDWQSRAPFYAVAARAMRQILVDAARRRRAAKRGGAWARTTLTGKPVPAELRPDEVLALDELLDQLDERRRRVVEYRFFAGMSEPEIAEALGVSVRTVQREWMHARAWLYDRLYAES